MLFDRYQWTMETIIFGRVLYYSRQLTASYLITDHITIWNTTTIKGNKGYCSHLFGMWCGRFKGFEAAIILNKHVLSFLFNIKYLCLPMKEWICPVVIGFCFCAISCSCPCGTNVVIEFCNTNWLAQQNDSI